MTTVVATGVSVNLGVLGLAIEACNLGYQVVVPRDAVAGHPRRVRRRGAGHDLPPHHHRDHDGRAPGGVGAGPGRLTPGLLRGAC